MTTGSVVMLQPLRDEILGLLRFARPAVGKVSDNHEPGQRLGKLSQQSEQDVGSAYVRGHKKVLPLQLLDVSVQYIALHNVEGRDS